MHACSIKSHRVGTPSLPKSSYRDLVALIKAIQLFEPERVHGDLNWKFYLKLGTCWCIFSAKLYQDTWYFSILKNKEFNNFVSFEFLLSSMQHRGAKQCDVASVSALTREIGVVYKHLRQDVLGYHAKLLTALPPTMRYGVLSRSLVQALLPDWLRFDRDLAHSELRALVRLLDRPDPPSLPTMTAGTYFRYVKCAYLANVASFVNQPRPFEPGASGRELYCTWADGRDGGLRDVELESEQAFEKWYNSKAHIGNHPFEIFRGGNSSHIDLYVSRNDGKNENGWRIALSAFSSTRLVETCRAALAMEKEKLPCAIEHRESYRLRLLGEDAVGIVPVGSGLTYAWHQFPRELKVADCIDFSWFRSPGTGLQLRPWREISRLVTWLPIRPLRIA